MEFDKKGPDFVQVTGGAEDEGASFKNIVLKQVQRVVDIMSEDYTAGGLEIIKKGMTQEVKDVGDKRLRIIRSIEVLDKLLKPHYNKGMVKKKKEMEEAIDKAENEVQNDIKVWVDSGKANINYADRSNINILLKHGLTPRDNPLYNIFIELALKIYEDLFSDLCFLLKEIHYLTEEEYGE